ncbi:MAG: FAD binding domain-containing protein [Prochloraceae cyanobacterium]|nr:FAD binding domain-containing protein [Prochloraceae cyanobacterium]
MIPVRFDYTAPENLEASVKLLSENQGAQILAGGHSLIEAMKRGQISPSLLIDLGKIKSLQGIEHEAKGFLQIGAMTTYDKVARASEIRENYSALAEAANSIGDPQIRNWGRIGDIFAYRDLACDLPAAALALEATFNSVGTRGNRTIVADEFVVLCFEMQWQLNEIITSIDFPDPTTGAGSTYECIKHPASSCAVCGIAASIEPSNNTVGKCRVAVTGATSYAIRLLEVENAMEGKTPTAENIALAAKLAKENAIGALKTNEGLTILSDLYASAEYRTHLIGVLTQRALFRAAERAKFSF